MLLFCKITDDSLSRRKQSLFLKPTLFFIDICLAVSGPDSFSVPVLFRVIFTSLFLNVREVPRPGSPPPGRRVVSSRRVTVLSPETLGSRSCVNEKRRRVREQCPPENNWLGSQGLVTAGVLDFPGGPRLVVPTITWRRTEWRALWREPRSLLWLRLWGHVWTNGGAVGVGGRVWSARVGASVCTNKDGTTSTCVNSPLFGSTFCFSGKTSAFFFVLLNLQCIQGGEVKKD